MNTVDKLILRNEVEQAFNNDDREKTLYSLGFITGYSVASSTVSQGEFTIALTAREAFKIGNTVGYKQAIAKLYAITND